VNRHEHYRMRRRQRFEDTALGLEFDPMVPSDMDDIWQCSRCCALVHLHQCERHADWHRTIEVYADFDGQWHPAEIVDWDDRGFAIAKADAGWEQTLAEAPNTEPSAALAAWRPRRIRRSL
jgi:hypothetical protein